jgi:transcriptional regulator with XRE-family HTH domain
MKDIVDRILHLLADNDMTARELAERLGLDKTTVSAWKSGRFKPSVEAVIEISRLFSVSLNWLLTGEEEPIASSSRLTKTEEILIEEFRNADKEKHKAILKLALGESRVRALATAPEDEDDNGSDSPPSIDMKMEAADSSAS